MLTYCSHCHYGSTSQAARDTCLSCSKGVMLACGGTAAEFAALRKTQPPVQAKPTVDDGWPKLEKPARVSPSVTFGAGVSARLVVEWAYRNHELNATPAMRAKRAADTNRHRIALDELVAQSLDRVAAKTPEAP